MALGDSFTFGSELAPLGYSTNDRVAWPASLNKIDLESIESYRKEHAFPYVLGRMLRADEVINLGEPGVGNHRILMSLLGYLGTVSDTRDLMIVIGWTNPARLDTYNQESNRWKTLYAWNAHESDDSKCYYKHIYSEKESHQRWLSQVSLAQQICLRRGAGYFMFSSIGMRATNLLHDHEIFDPVLDTTCFYSDKDMKLFCQDAGSRFYQHGHPMLEGHAAWASHLHGLISKRWAIDPMAEALDGLG